jgi:hypothetical protein
MFQKLDGNWTTLRDNIPNLMIVDLHFGRGEPGQWCNNMAEVYAIVTRALKDAQAWGCDFVMFKHGHSTSYQFKTTTRSIVRGIMRSKESTPFIIKAKSIQHYSVFVAKIRPLAG